jgi:hypothetical protein
MCTLFLCTVSPIPCFSFAVSGCAARSLRRPLRFAPTSFPFSGASLAALARLCLSSLLLARLIPAAALLSVSSPRFFRWPRGSLPTSSKWAPYFRWVKTGDSRPRWSSRAMIGLVSKRRGSSGVRTYGDLADGAGRVPGDEGARFRETALLPGIWRGGEVSLSGEECLAWRCSPAGVGSAERGRGGAGWRRRGSSKVGILG